MYHEVPQECMLNPCVSYNISLNHATVAQVSGKILREVPDHKMKKCKHSLAWMIWWCISWTNYASLILSLSLSLSPSPSLLQGNEGLRYTQQSCVCVPWHVPACTHTWYTWNHKASEPGSTWGESASSENRQCWCCRGSSNGCLRGWLIRRFKVTPSQGH